MAHSTLRVGLIGAGANTRLRHIPGLQALADVAIVAVCNRRPESTAAIAREFNIPRTFERWEDLVADPDIEAVVIGTWPYLHCPITLAALQAGKHVLTEARLSMNAQEAHQMLAASRKYPKLVTQVVPSPYGFKGHQTVKELVDADFLGELREIRVTSLAGWLGDPAAPLSWRQDRGLSGFNMLTLGILHETLSRWIPQPIRVMAQAHAFIASRIDPASGVRLGVGTPDSVQVLTSLANGARAVYQIGAVTPFGEEASIVLLGSHGALHYDLGADRLFGTSQKTAKAPLSLRDLPEILIPAEKALGWRVEADFVDAIRLGTPIRFTDFATGVAYMEFTEAVARSAHQHGLAVNLPLDVK